MDVTGPNTNVKCDIRQVDDFVYRVSYLPQTAGPHKIDISFAGFQIPKSPYHVDISLRKLEEFQTNEMIS